MKRGNLEKIMSLLEIKTQINKMHFVKLQQQQQSHRRQADSLSLKAKTAVRDVGTTPSPGELALQSAFIAVQQRCAKHEALLAQEIEPLVQEANSKVRTSLQHEISMKRKLAAAIAVVNRKTENAADAQREEIHSFINARKNP